MRAKAIAFVFGTGPVVDAYVVASIVPSFFLVLLGGINGPFHSAIVSVIAKQKKKEDIAPIIETVTTLVGIALIMVAIALAVFAAPVIDIVGRNLQATDVGLLVTRPIAVTQLRIMAPIAVLAGLIGIGFGALNATDQYWLPSISPMLSSVAVIVGVGISWLIVGPDITDPDFYLLGGIVLAVGTLVGAFFQWLIQVPTLWQSGLGRLRLRFDVNNPDVGNVLKVLGPATLSSGTMQINVYTDLFFASAIPATLAGLEFSNYLVQAPLGIVSSVILVPFFPIFSRLTEPSQWPELKQRIRQSLVLVGLTMLPISALIITLARVIVTVLYKGGSFGEDSVTIVTSLLVAYGVGMFVYLARDVMVRVFYALGDGQTPFNISLANIVTNAVLDYVLFNLMGPPGLIYATVGVNIVSLIAMTILLDRKLGGLPLADWARTIFTLTVASFLSGVSCWLTKGGLASITGTEGFLANFVQMCVAGGVGLLTFALLTIVLKIPEADLLAQRIRQKLGR